MAAFVAALDRAMAIINGDPAAATQLYIAEEKSKLPADFLEGIIHAEDTVFTIEPQASMKFAAFMARTGSIKTGPQS
jgi:NitT/TauT family transport system substrate-binding protein